MPDKPVSSQSVGKAVVTFFRSLAFAGSRRGVGGAVCGRLHG